MAWLSRGHFLNCWPRTSISAFASYREDLPKSAPLEAAACGVPIITTDTSGARKSLTDGENGLLVPRWLMRSARASGRAAIG